MATYENGAPWCQQCNINTTQAGDLAVGWTVGTGLPVGMAFGNAVLVKNKVHLFAWANSSSIDYEYILTYDVDSSGIISTSYTQTSFPFPRRLAQVVVIGDYLYVLGGYIAGSGTTSTIIRSTIQEDGSLGTFSSYGTLPATYLNFRAAVIKDRLYLFGGDSQTTPYTTNVVRYCPINTDGSLGAWTTSGNLSFNVADPSLVVTPGYVYLLGGELGNGSYTSECQRAAISSNGDLLAWATVPGLYIPGYASLWRSAVVVSEDAFYLIGGRITNTNTGNVYYGSIDSSGAITSMAQSATTLNYPSFGSSVVVTSSLVYVFGGLNALSYYSTNIFHTSYSGGLNDYTSFTGGTSGVSGDGVFEGPIDEITGTGIAPVVGWGSFIGIEDQLSANGYSTIEGYGSFEDPLDDILGVALSALADGAFEDPLGDLSGVGTVPVVGFGAFDSFDEIVGSGSAFIIGDGEFGGITDEITADAVNMASTVYGTGAFSGIVDEVLISGENNTVIGRFVDPLDSVSGLGVVPVVGFGRFVDPLTRIAATGFLGEDIAVGDFIDPADVLSGSGVVPVVGFGSFDGYHDQTSGYAVNLDIVVGTGSFTGILDAVAGYGELTAVGIGSIRGVLDSTSGLGVVPIVGFGSFNDIVDSFSGFAGAANTFSVFEFARCDTYNGELSSGEVVSPLSFVRCNVDVFPEYSDADATAPLSFSRCN